MEEGQEFFSIRKTEALTLIVHASVCVVCVGGRVRGLTRWLEGPVVVWGADEARSYYEVGLGK